MTGGFLDRSAPDITAEYSRYIDGDVLGKLIVRNLLVNRLGHPPEKVFTPVGRYGDAKVKYAKAGAVVHDPGDGHVEVSGKRVTFEVKCARINMANRFRGDASSENWAFTNLLASPGKKLKTYDVLIAVGVRVLGLEHEHFWPYLELQRKKLQAQGRPFELHTRPHEPEYLSLCSFFMLPRSRVMANGFRTHLASVSSCRYAAYHARGYDTEACRATWLRAVELAE